MNKKPLYLILVLIVLAGIFCSACRSKTGSHKVGNDIIYVTIPPLKYLVDHIIGESILVEVLVPYGASPETFEPTPRQLKDLTNSVSVFTTGLLDFEKMLINRTSGNIMTPIVDLSKGIDLIEDAGHVHNHGHNHSHCGGDPHIWSSPSRLKKMAETICAKLTMLYPEESDVYAKNLRKLQNELDVLDSEIKAKIGDSNVKYVLIYHPALTYYTDDYGIEQVSLEEAGKEPSAEHFRNIVDLAKSNGIDVILYQKEFSTAVVQTIARDIGAKMVEIDPLDEDVMGNLRRITHLITKL